jgi:uncharacterized membrane protein
MAGDTVKLTYSVKNNGDLSSGTWGYRVYGSTSSANTTTGKTALYTYNSNTSLVKNATKTLTLSSSVKIPSNAKAGSYYIHFWADYAKAKAEYSESNNWRWVKVTIASKPDLDITSVTFNSTYNAGNVISVKYTIKNIGKATATNSLTKLWLSQNTSTSSGNTLKYNSSELSLAANGTRTVTRSVTLPKAMASGTWYIGVQADGAGQVSESNEGNNWYWRSLKVNKNVYIDTAVSEYKSALVGTSTVGNVFSHRCPTGYIATGVQGYYSGSYIRRYRLYCRYLNNTGTHGTIKYTAYLGTTSLSGTYISSYAANSAYLVRQRGRFGASYLEGMLSYSRTWQDVLKGASNYTGKSLGEKGKTSGGSVKWVSCPNGSVVTGIYGRATAYPRQIGVYCRKLKGAW